MRMSIQDRNELMKAVTRAEDLKSLKLYILAMVDAIDDLPEGKYDAPVPRYVEPTANGSGSSAGGQVVAAERWTGDGRLLA